MKIQQSYLNKSDYFSVYFESIRGEYDAVWSTHSYYEFMILYTGEFYVQLGEKRYFLKKGDILMIKPNQPHRVEPKDSSEFQLISIVMSKKFQEYLSSRGISWDPYALWEKNLPFPVLTIENGQNIQMEMWMTSLVHEMKNQHKFRGAYITNLSELLLLEIGRLCASLHPVTVQDRFWGDHTKELPELLQHVLDYINTHYCEPITLCSIAGEFWLNPSYLSRYFKKHMGVNIVEYIRVMRIFFAKALLQSTENTIAEISEIVGFKSISYFNSIFIKEVGMSPGKFRKSHIGNMSESPVNHK